MGTLGGQFDAHAGGHVNWWAGMPKRNKGPPDILPVENVARRFEWILE